MDTRTPQRTRWLSLVGIGDDGLAGLGESAKLAVAGAEILIGGERHLSFLPEDGRTKIPWTAPLDDVIRKIRDYQGEKVCVLASGDPFFYGIGAKLAEQFPIEEMNVLPAPSSLSLALSRLGWSFPDIRVVTLHGRPLENLIPHLIPGARLIILSENRETPRRVAEVMKKKDAANRRFMFFPASADPRSLVFR